MAKLAKYIDIPTEKYTETHFSYHEPLSKKQSANEWKSAQAEVLQAKAAVTNAANSLSYTVVKSPSAGVIGSLPYKIGALVSGNMTEPLTYISDNGEMAPASQFMHLTKTFGAQSLNRFNLFTSISVTGTPAEGRSNGEAMKAIERVAKEKLPQGYSYEYGGLSLEESKSSNNFVIVFALSILIIYLVLAALYESLILPMSILLTVPVGILGSFIMAQVLGIENNIYMQTGIVLLIGLLSKTGILITEYAVEHRQQGHGLVKSGYEAAKERFRPILMTVLAMVLGLLPLMFASGAGANGSRSLASCVVGGMIVGSIALLFLVPALFVIFQWMQEHWMPKRLIDVLRASKVEKQVENS